MSMRLQMIQKSPVIFTQYDPARAISESDRAIALGVRQDDAVPWLWISYGRAVLADVDPCMEANEGVAATLSFSSHYKDLSGMEVIPVSGKCYKLMLGKATLFLSESAEGDLFLYFFPPGKYINSRETCRIDLTDYSSETAAYFISMLFSVYGRITDYYKTNKHE